jgi:hypothetical protein
MLVSSVIVVCSASLHEEALLECSTPPYIQKFKFVKFYHEVRLDKNAAKIIE